MVELNCFKCSASMKFEGLIPRREECPSCSADVHVCLNCRFYDRGSYNECREPQAEVVQEKERANFCDYFEPGSGAGAGEKKDEMMSAAEALFKKS